MSFIENIKECIGLDAQPLNPPFRAVLFGDTALYLEGVKQIVSFTSEEMVLGLKQGGLKIKGTNLYVKKYCGGDVVVCGKILGLERL